MSELGARVIIFINKFFPKVVHPFNLNNEGIMTYADWQFEKGDATIACYKGFYTPEEMFCGKRVLDCGCGEGGKSVYYASLGAVHVQGIDIVPYYKERSENFAAKKDLSDRFSFSVENAAAMSFTDNSFDTVIMNDFVEHVSDPEGAIREALRVLRPGGRIYANFPPYYHPFGAHLSDAISIPWVHRFFSEDSMIRAYCRLVADCPDVEERISFRFSTDERGKRTISYINRMTIKRFEGIIQSLGLCPVHYHLIPLRGFLAPFAKLPFLREYLNKMVVCVIEK